MKRFSYTIPLALLGSILPLFVFAQFQGPSQVPPNGNVPGVIWNTAGTNIQQIGAQINIDGDVNADGSLNAKGDITANDINASGDVKTVGDVITRTVSTTPEVIPNTIFNYNLANIKLQPGKAFRVDQNGSASYWMGNWGGTSGSQKPLTFSLNGDFYAYALAPSGAGQEGRIQADKFCFHPGTGASDCVTSWALNSGLYVQKVGDFMTGTLSITVPSNTTGIVVNGGSIGGDFNGSNLGLLVNGGTYGSYIGGPPAYGTWISFPPYGTYITVPVGSSYGLYVNAASGLTGSTQAGIYAQVPTTTLGIYTTGRLEAAGDLDVAGNKWGGPNSGTFTSRYQTSVFGVSQWTDYSSSNKCGIKVSDISTSGTFTCPSGTYLSGVELNSSQQVTNLVCCML